MSAVRTNKALFGFAVATVVATLVLILAGGFVTTTATGDTIPTWPLSWGRLLPHSFEGGIVVEWSHRVIAGTVALMVLALTLWVHLAHAGKGAKTLAWIALAAILVQALIGGLRIYIPRSAVAIVHACFGQAVFCTVTALALVLSRAWSEAAPDKDAARARRLGVTTSALLFMQMVAGAFTRHTAHQHAIWIHVVGALVVFLHVAILSGRLAYTSLKADAYALMTLLGLQFALGMASWGFRGTYLRSHEAPMLVLVTVSSHVAVGALLLAFSVVATLRCFRVARAADRFVTVVG